MNSCINTIINTIINTLLAGTNTTPTYDKLGTEYSAALFPMLVYAHEYKSEIAFD
jgi:hypothetical protein